MRYFDNRFPKYDGGEVKVDTKSWSQQICQLTESIIQGFPAVFENCDGGLYVGNAGIAYMFYYLSSNQNLQDYHQVFLEQAVMYSKISNEFVKISGGSQKDRVAFLLGEAGVLATSSLIQDAVGATKEADKFAEKYGTLADVCMPLNFLRCGSDELFVGRAGYLCGVMNLHKSLKRKVIKLFRILRGLASVTHITLPSE